MKEATTNKRISRPAVVVVMGHIDHGKSTLLDYIRKTKVVEGEHGGITQHISCYEAEFKAGDGKVHSITFLDTPGHAAFTAIRERGSRAADIGILVVSAEDGVKPQTLEAIDWIKKNNMPYVVAISKIDKPNANPDKAKTELAEKEVLVEGWGGTVPCILVSAKSGEGVNDLLETIVLQAEVDGISYDPEASATGFVIESERDAKRGIAATMIVKDGILKKGMFVRAGSAVAPVRIVEDFRGKQIEEAKAGTPVAITGWSEVPPVGAVFHTYVSKNDAEKEAGEFGDNEKDKQNENRGKKGDKEVLGKTVPVVIKADTVGSLEAIIHEVKKLDSENISAKIISYGAGTVSEADVKLAKSSREIILLGFNVKVDPTAKDIAIRENIDIKIFNVIYELAEWLKNELEARSPKEEVDDIFGKAVVYKVFSQTKKAQVIGGKVEEGVLESGATVKILRREIEIGEGYVRELQSKKVKIGKVEEGGEFGALVESKMEIVSGDKILCVRKVVK